MILFCPSALQFFRNAIGAFKEILCTQKPIACQAVEIVRLTLSSKAVARIVLGKPARTERSILADVYPSPPSAGVVSCLSRMTTSGRLLPLVKGNNWAQTYTRRVQDDSSRGKTNGAVNLEQSIHSCIF